MRRPRQRHGACAQPARGPDDTTGDSLEQLACTTVTLTESSPQGCHLLNGLLMTALWAVICWGDRGIFRKH